MQQIVIQQYNMKTTSEDYLVLLFVEEVCGSTKSTLLISRSSFRATLLTPGAGVAFVIIIIGLACRTRERVPVDGPATGGGRLGV